MKLHKTKENEIYYYYLKNGDKRYMYRHKYVDVLGKRKEKKKSGFKTEKAALKALLKIKAALLDEDIRPIENNEMFVSQWLDIWYEAYHKQWKDKTVQDISSVIKLHFKPLIGKQKLTKLNHSTYTNLFINDLLSKGFSPSTIRLYHKYFMMAINSAVRDDVITENKFKRVQIKEKKQRDNYLTAGELKHFLEYAKKIGNITQWSLTLLLAYSGMRKGEALALKWSDISFEKRTVSIEKTRDSISTREPKSYTSYRTIELDPLVLNQLEKYEKWCIKTKLSYGLQHKTNDYIFISDSAYPVYDSFINTFFHQIYEYAKEKNIKLKTISPHGLRHTHASILIDALIPPSDVAFRLGNTLEMVLKVYAHKLKKQNNETVSVFGDSLKHVK